MKRFGWIAVAFFFMSCGNQSTSSKVSEVFFDPNPVTVAGGICSSQAQILSTSEEPVALVAMSASFLGANGSEQTFTYSDTDLADMISTPVVPGNGLVEVSLSFDLSGGDVELPAEGTVVFIGTGVGSSVSFVGSFVCRA